MSGSENPQAIRSIRRRKRPQRSSGTDGATIHATINVDNIAYAVEVSGKPTPLTKTGKGLALGATVEDLNKIYVLRFARKTNEINLEWKDGTEMRAKLHGKQIESILLLANVE